MLINEHANYLSTCSEKEATKLYQTSKMNTQQGPTYADDTGRAMYDWASAAQAITVASHASRPTQLDPAEACCLLPHQCKFDTRPMNVQCSVFCSCSAFLAAEAADKDQ